MALKVKKKIKNINDNEKKEICDSHIFCETCPLRLPPHDAQFFRTSCKANVLWVFGNEEIEVNKYEKYKEKI